MYATDAQLSYLEDTLTAHQLYSGHYDRLWAILEAARIDERQRGDGTPLSSSQAARIRVWLDRQVARIQGRPAAEYAAARRFGCHHVADRHGNCVTCGAEMYDASLTRTAVAR